MKLLQLQVKLRRGAAGAGSRGGTRASAGGERGRTGSLRSRGRGSFEFPNRSSEERSRRQRSTGVTRWRRQLATGECLHSGSEALRFLSPALRVLQEEAGFWPKT